MNNKFRLFIFLFIFFHNSLIANDNEDVKTDILFLKIQELESEIAELRNKVESQDYLIEKLINESINSDEENSENIQDLAINTDVRFKGIEDPKSIDQVYKAAIDALETQDLEKAFVLFKYFVDSFNDEEKKPLSYFWLGEISLMNGELDQSKNFFMELISLYPNHYRVPLAHKKIGDIYLKTDDIKSEAPFITCGCCIKFSEEFT